MSKFAGCLLRWSAGATLVAAWVYVGGFAAKKTDLENVQKLRAFGESGRVVALLPDRRNSQLRSGVCQLVTVENESRSERMNVECNGHLPAVGDLWSISYVTLSNRFELGSQLIELPASRAMPAPSADPVVVWMNAHTTWLLVPTFLAGTLLPGLLLAAIPFAFVGACTLAMLFLKRFRFQVDIEMDKCATAFSRKSDSPEALLSLLLCFFAFCGLYISVGEFVVAVNDLSLALFAGAALGLISLVGCIYYRAAH